MARAIFVILLLANVLFFAWAANYLGREEEGHEPGRLKAQLQADRLNVMARDAAAPAQTCRRAGPVTLSDAERLKTALAAVAGIKVAVNAVEETNYWVYIPPLSDKNAADKKAAELKKMGVGDYYVVGDAGPYHNAISLGSFSNEETAKDLFDRLAKKGVRSARIDTRQRPADKALIEVRGEAALVAKGLADLLPATTTVVDCGN